MTPASAFYLVRFLAFGALGYAWSCVKNCVKVLIGRKPYFTHQNTFFRLYLLQLLGLKRIRKLTCVGFTTEGPGSQALMMMRAIAFARAFGLTYVHTPFGEIAHNGRPTREWTEAWEDHFNLGAGEIACNGEDRDIVNFGFNFPEMYRLFGVDDWLQGALVATIPEIKRKYRTNKQRSPNRDIRIWVQVRRGEITSDMHDNWTSTSFIAETLKLVCTTLDARSIRYSISIYSQGDEADDLSALATMGAEIIVGNDPVWSMRQAVEADILIMAKSSFSYVTALISDGIKVYEPCGYPPLNDWVRRGPNSEFDQAAFERQLQLLVESKAENDSAAR